MRIHSGLVFALSVFVTAACACAEDGGQEANEQAAIAACKTFASAQDVYRRTDWDADGVLEYAQAIRGAFSLYERTEGAEDLALVDAAFANAEGTPVVAADLKMPAPTEEQLKTLKEQLAKLGDEDFTTRENAAKQIEALGPAVIAALEKHAADVKNQDPETVGRCKAIAHALRKVELKKLSGETKKAVPKAGYCFRVLNGQGAGAPGGKKSYVVNNNSILGYAVVAFPAEYGKSGKRTFIMNNTGTIYGRDLGADTVKLATEMTEYNPEKGWEVVE